MYLCRSKEVFLTIKTDRMAKVQGAIQVNSERCKGCAVCTVNCPHEVIAMGTEVNSKGYAIPYMEKAANCTGCNSCAIVCPDGAIMVYRVKID